MLVANASPVALTRAKNKRSQIRLASQRARLAGLRFIPVAEDVSGFAASCVTKVSEVESLGEYTRLYPAEASLEPNPVTEGQGELLEYRLLGKHRLPCLPHRRSLQNIPSELPRHRSR